LQFKKYKPGIGVFLLSSRLELQINFRLLLKENGIFSESFVKAAGFLNMGKFAELGTATCGAVRNMQGKAYGNNIRFMS
jgi:hypothetical protein